MQNSRFYFKSLVVILFLVASACEPLNEISRGPQMQHYSLDGIKQISPALHAGEDPSSFTQARYKVSSTERLLLRLENLSNFTSYVSTRPADLITVQITVASSADFDRARQNFLLCPVTRDWMMLATWKRSQPFNQAGIWSQEGGDFNADECVQSNAAVGDSTLLFDTTKWFQNWVKGRGQKFWTDFTLAASAANYHSRRCRRNRTARDRMGSVNF